MINLQKNQDLNIELIDHTLYSIRQVREILALSLDLPSEEYINALIDDYFVPLNKKHLFLAKAYDITVGLIGIEQTYPYQAVIHHIAVEPDLQWKGVGRFMIGAVANEFNLHHIHAEVDSSIVLFFKACDFKITKTSKQRGLYYCEKKFEAKY